MKIVIVEDEIRTREGIVGLLHKFYSHSTGIWEAKCGEEGLKLIREIRPDVVITDIRMEPMDGLEMITILTTHDKLSFKTIILSAYSEFEYAKKAISLGVREYLVKPIDVGEFRSAMARLKEEMENDKMNRLGNYKTLDSVDAVLNGLISGKVDTDPEINLFFEKTYAINSNADIALLCIYLGKNYNNQCELTANIIRTLAADNHKINPLFVPDDEILIYAFVIKNDFNPLEYCQNVVIKKINALTSISAVYVFGQCKGIEQFKECFDVAKIHLQWAIPLGMNRLLSVDEINSMQAVVPPYPIEIERQSIACLCTGDYKRLQKQGEYFIDYFKGSPYNPESIKKYCLRYILTVLQVVKEINFTTYENTNEQEIMRNIDKSVTDIELKEMLFNIFLFLYSRHNEIKTGLLVQKVLRMVDEYYRNGITLEEVSYELKVTPDYISARLVRELGMNFSTYIRNYRLRRAKELLIGTDLKLFEIAEQVGYKDAKYFGRVFREAEGLLPADYRKKFR